jgi:hypothetical protein
MGPVSRQIVLRAGITADLRAHVPAAPRGWPSGIADPVRMMTMPVRVMAMAMRMMTMPMVVVSSRFCR